MAKIERGRLKEPLAPELMEVMIKPTITPTEVKRSYQTYLYINEAHVLMLLKQGIIKKDAAAKILKATAEMVAMGEEPDFPIVPELEEIYLNLENHLVGMVGIEAGGQQHTARSRNDLHACAERIDTRNALLKFTHAVNTLRHTLIQTARENKDAVMSGYTHLQPSEPITFAHYLSAISSALTRDYTRLIRAWDATNLNPLGGGSMGSTTWPIDREMTTRLMGFDGIVQNSLDCVASRDYQIEIMNALSLTALTLNRVATDFRLWSAPEYGYIEVGDCISECSSIMPQKKNAVTFECMTGAVSRVKGAGDIAWMTYKGIPYTFTIESTEIARQLWAALEDTENTVRLLDVSLKHMKIRKDRARRAAASNFSTVTELANTLVRVEKISFREAHEIVAHLVAHLVETGKKPADITHDVLNEIGEPVLKRGLVITDEEIHGALDPVKLANSKTVLGGTAPSEVERQLRVVERALCHDENQVLAYEDKLNAARAETAKLAKKVFSEE